MLTSSIFSSLHLCHLLDPVLKDKVHSPSVYQSAKCQEETLVNK